MSFYLVNFARNNTINKPADYGEKIGNFGLGLLRIGFGKTVEVSKFDNTQSGISHKGKIYSVIKRIVAIALFFTLFPVTGTLAGIGCIGFACSTSRQNMLNHYLGCKKKLSELLNMNFSKGDTIVKLCENLPYYDSDVKTDNVIITEEKLEQSRKELVVAVQHQQNLVNTQQLIKLKTQYLKMRDIYKFSKHQGQGIPNPSVELTLTPPDDFIKKLQAPLLGTLKDLVLKDPSEPITQIPEYLYKYDHPRDSEEGVTPLFQVLGGQKQADSKWKSALDFVQKEVLSTPIKDLKLEGFYNLIFSLHDKLVGCEEKIRDQFMLVADPEKSEISFPSFKAYLKKQEDGDKLVKRISRFDI